MEINIKWIGREGERDEKMKTKRKYIKRETIENEWH